LIRLVLHLHQVLLDQLIHLLVLVLDMLVVQFFLQLM
jgi:hypothetical protein